MQPLMHVTIQNRLMERQAIPHADLSCRHSHPHAFHISEYSPPWWALSWGLAPDTLCSTIDYLWEYFSMYFHNAVDCYVILVTQRKSVIDIL